MVERRGLLLACEARLTPSAVSEVREERAPVLFERSSELRVSPGAFGHLCSQGGEFGLTLISPRDVGVADQAGVGAHGAARHAHLSEIEGRAIAAGPPAHHHQTGFRATDADECRDFAALFQ